MVPAESLAEAVERFARKLLTTNDELVLLAPAAPADVAAWFGHLPDPPADSTSAALICWPGDWDDPLPEFFQDLGLAAG